MLNSRLPCEFRASASDGPGLDEIPTRPLLTVGYQPFVGIDEIREYIINTNPTIGKESSLYHSPE